jgi:hypothetical protein
MDKQYLGLGEVLAPHILEDISRDSQIPPTATKNMINRIENCCCSFLPDLVFGSNPKIDWIRESNCLKIGDLLLRFCPICGGSLPTSIKRKDLWTDSDEKTVSAFWIGQKAEVLMNEAKMRDLWAYKTQDIVTIRELLKDTEIDFLLDPENNIKKLTFRFSPISSAYE